MVVCLEQGADLHMAQLMPLHSLSLASVKSRLVVPFWYRLTRVVPEKGPLNGCVCMYVTCIGLLGPITMPLTESRPITNSFFQFAELKLGTVDRHSSANCTSKILIGALMEYC